MNFYGINAASRETGFHQSSLRRWEDMGLITRLAWTWARPPSGYIRTGMWTSSSE